jgi:outer membrane protein assembly factor BamB
MLWTFPTGGEIDSSPVICGDKVVFGSADGRIYLLNLDDGKELWSYEIGAGIVSSPAVVGDRVIIAAEDGLVYAFGP